MSSEMTIGRAANAAGVNVDTIRYYQRRGLVEEPELPLGGQRKYGEDTIRRVRFIKRAQALGFSLDEVGNLLQLEDGDNCSRTKAIAQRKLKIIEERIADLSRMRESLGGLVAQCSAGKRPRACPIIASLLER